MELEKDSGELLLDLLVEEGIVDSVVAAKVRRRRRETWIPIGKALRLKGWLTVDQVGDLLESQARQPTRRIGELACDRGLCTASQVEDALRTQRDLSPHVLHFVADAPGLEQGKLLRAMVRYARALEERYAARPIG